MSMDSWIDGITFPHRIAFPRLSLADRLAGRNLYANIDWYDNVVIACYALPEFSMLLAASYELGRCAEQANGCRRKATRNVHIPSWGNLLSSVWSQISHPTGIEVTAWLHYERHRTQDFDHRHPSIQWSTLASSLWIPVWSWQLAASSSKTALWRFIHRWDLMRLSDCLWMGGSSVWDLGRTWAKSMPPLLPPWLSLAQEDDPSKTFGYGVHLNLMLKSVLYSIHL